MQAFMLMLHLAISQCGASCPLPPSNQDLYQIQQIIQSGIPFEIELKAVTKQGTLIHTSKGFLNWQKKVHLGGKDLRNLGFDRPDYEVRSQLITPEKVWTSI